MLVQYGCVVAQKSLKAATQPHFVREFILESRLEGVFEAASPPVLYLALFYNVEESMCERKAIVESPRPSTPLLHRYVLDGGLDGHSYCS